MTRAILGLQENSSGLFTITYKLIRKCIEQDQDFTGEMRYSDFLLIKYNEILFCFVVKMK
jgi:hypothetical protein